MTAGPGVGEPAGTGEGRASRPVFAVGGGSVQRRVFGGISGLCSLDASLLPQLWHCHVSLGGETRPVGKH